MSCLRVCQCYNPCQDMKEVQDVCVLMDNISWCWHVFQIWNGSTVVGSWSDDLIFFGDVIRFNFTVWTNVTKKPCRCSVIFNFLHHVGYVWWDHHVDDVRRNVSINAAGIRLHLLDMDQRHCFLQSNIVHSPSCSQILCYLVQVKDLLSVSCTFTISLE